MADINYSIIIPHKNIPDLLRRCLNSIPRRDDIQIIVVDDNSDENKVDFKHFPGVGEKCVEVYFTKEGRGAGYARNVGLRHAKGKWLLFADADDFYNQNFLKVLDLYIGDELLDILYFSVSSVDSETLEYSNRSGIISDLIAKYRGDENFDNEKLLRYTLWVPWNKMFNRNFVNACHLTFDEIISGNDAFFVVRAGYFARKIKVEYSELYCVTYRTSSLTYCPSKISLEDALDMRLRLNNFFTSIGENNMSVLLYGLVILGGKRYGVIEFLKLFVMVIRKRQLHLFFKQINACLKYKFLGYFRNLLGLILYFKFIYCDLYRGDFDF